MNIAGDCFLCAIIVPSLVLVALSLRMISQERELAEKRAFDEQNRRVNDIRQELQTRLESRVPQSGKPEE